MGLPQKLGAHLRGLLFGSPFGEVYGGKPPPLPTEAAAVDGRTIALRLLRDYLCSVIFYLPKGDVVDRGFTILPENFLLEIPDNVHDLKYPSLAVLPGNWEYLPVGFAPRLVADTWNRFGPGTAVQKHAAEYQEDIKLEMWASKEPELRSMRAGIELALNPVEEMSGLRFYMDRYWGQPVVFTMMRGEATPGELAGKGRRSAVIVVQMRFELASLVNVVPFFPTLLATVDADANGVLVNVVPTINPSLALGNPNAPVPPPRDAQYVLPADAVDAGQYERAR
jgi:hypothetical protein